MADACNPTVVLVHARAWLGTPFHRHAAARGVGADCAGFVCGVYADVVGARPERPPWRSDWAAREATAIARYVRAHLVPSPRQRPGDVVTFRLRGREAHLGILDETGAVLHVTERAGVVRAAAPPWDVTGWWSLPAAPGCATGSLRLTPERMLAVVHGDDGEVPHYRVQDALDATPLSVSRAYPTAAAARAAVPAGIGFVERV